MKAGWSFLALAATVAAGAVYALNQGIYVGSSIYRSPYIQDQYEKDCRYFVLFRIYSQPSGGGHTPEAADQNGYCPLLQEPFATR